MAHGYLSATDIRGQTDLLGQIAGAIGSRIKKSSDMARKERAYASKQAEKGGTSLEEAGIGRGYFFKRALGSSFGGDRIARTRGRFESDPPAGRDPSGTQASRFRGGFDYGVTNTISSPTGGALANIVKGGPSASGGIAGFLGPGAQAINPEILGGELARYQGTKKNAAGFTVDTTATEVSELAGILNQIGQLIVRTSNNTITAVDGVQKVNVRVIESIQSLGKLQSAIADRQMNQQLMLAAASENHQEQMLSRQLAAAEASRFTQDDYSGNLAVNSFGGRLPGQGGFGGRGGGGGRGLAGFGAKAAAHNIGKAVMKRGGARAATRLGAAAGMKVAGKSGAKIGAKIGAKTLGGMVGKKLPFGLGLAVAGGFAADRFGKGDVIGGIGEILSGLAATIPGVGTAASLGIDGLLAARDFGMVPFANGGIVSRPTAGLVGEAGTEGIFPLEGKKGRETFLKFGEGMMEAQRKNETAYIKRETTVLENYFDRKGGWDRFGEILAELIKNLNPFRRNGDGNGNGGPSGGNFSGNSGEDKAMNYLMGQGLTQAQAAGIAGNLQQESGFNPLADNTGTGENDSRGHFGIAQWDKVHRWPKVKKWMQDNGLDPYSLEGQLQALKWEAGERGDWNKITKTKTAEESAASWLENFERSGEKPGEAGYDNRIANAQRLATKQLSGVRSGTGMATFGETGRVSNAQGYVHGHFQTNSGTKADLVNDVTPVVRQLLNSGVSDVTITDGTKFTSGMSDAEIRSIIEKGISKHSHSGDGRSVDIFVPKGTPVPFPLSDVKNTGGNGGVTGVLPGSGKVWVGHLTNDSQSGSRQPMPAAEPPVAAAPATPPSQTMSSLFSLSPTASQPDVLTKSAQVSAQNTAMKLNPMFVMAPQQNQGGSNAPILPTSMAGPSSGMVTPSWLINANLR